MHISIFNHRTLTTVLQTCCLTFTISLLTSCGSSGKNINADGRSFEAGHGPFDANGNYREDWADSPPKRRAKPTKKTSSTTQKKKKKSYTPPKKTYTPPKKTYTPPKKKYTPPKKKYTPPKKKKYTPPKKKKYTPPKKATPKKIKPKTKPPIYHTVKKGDTLYGLSRKYGTSAAVIQKANKLTGSNIRLGQRLIIPRK